MATNKELIKNIADLAGELDLEDIETAGKSNAELNNMAKALRIQREAKAAKAPTAPEAPRATGGAYVVAPGKSLTTLRGVLGAGAPIEARFLSGGDVAFKALQAKKYIVHGA